MARRTGDDWSQRDYYAILGVPATASRDEINRAYRRRARAAHPDVNSDDPGAELRFEDLAAAREVLTDPTSRAAYDELRNARSEVDDRAGDAHAPTGVQPRPVRAGSSGPPAPSVPVLGGARRPRPPGTAIRPGPVVWTPSEVGRP